MNLKPGVTLHGGSYRIIDTLGRGGFGITYLAEQVMAERKVCIKEFFPEEYYNRDANGCSISLGSQGSAKIMETFKAKFIKEAKTIAKFDHTNIIHIHDVFEENNTAYYVMEYIDGESLSAVVKRRGALDEAAAVGYIRQVADALGYIHEQRIMHLDVKPGNVMLRSRDDRAILIDFGLSKHYNAESGEATSSSPVGVSHGFAPMEQYKSGGVKEFSPATDIYSLGATLYYLVTGLVPPEAADISDEGLPALPAHLSQGVRTAIERSMADKRKARPQSIAEFLALLDDSEIVAIDDDDEDTHFDSTPNPTKPEDKKRSKWWLWLIVAAIILAGAFLFGGGDNGDKAKNTESAHIEQLRQDSIARAQRTQDSIKQAEHERHIQDSIATAKKQAEEAERVRIAEEKRKAEEERVRIAEEKRKAEEERVRIAEEKRINNMVAEGLGRDGIYQVGDYYNRNGKRGVVFEVWDHGRHGMILSLDEIVGEWCTKEQHDKGIMTTATSMSNGKDNTDVIIWRSDSSQYPAFKWCRAKGDSWYLPAINELKKIKNSVNKINRTLSQYDGDIIDTVNTVAWYLSSTAGGDEIPQYSAYFYEMSGEGRIGSYSRWYWNFKVRAVSAF